MAPATVLCFVTALPMQKSDNACPDVLGDDMNTDPKRISTLIKRMALGIVSVCLYSKAAAWLRAAFDGCLRGSRADGSFGKPVNRYYPGLRRDVPAFIARSQ